VTPESPVIAELRPLLDALCEESITPEQLQRLEELVLTHPEAEAYYVQFMSFYADLVRNVGGLPPRAERSVRQRAGAETAEPRPVAGPAHPPTPTPAAGSAGGAADPTRRGPRRPRYLVVGAAIGLAGIAAGLLLGLGPWLRPRAPVHLSPNPAPEAVDDTVAVLLRTHKAVWEESGLPTRPGAALSPGTLVLKSGLAQIEFYSGATVVLEGPAELRLESRTEAYCLRGKLRATVPPSAHGFTIRSPAMDFVDRGTEFGLDVGDRKTAVHVFEGKVDLYDPAADSKAAPRTELRAGHGASLDGPGIVNPIVSNSEAFVTADDLAAAAAKAVEERQREWAKASQALRKDPTLLVYYTFEPDAARTRVLPDEARGRAEPHDGTVVGCSWVTGRWAGKQGLEFKRVSDRVRLNVPGAFHALTLAAWVRVDALPNRYSSLLMTDGWDAGAPHWHIREDGKVSLGVQGVDGSPASHYFTGVVFPPERVGQWTNLAVVYDRDGGQVTHYADGRVVKRVPIKLDIPLHIGNAEIGNWNTGSRTDKYPVRHLSGCMDEFLLFSRALSDEEVERLYLQGRPPL
jgi:Concanavalin A-like lectin/glucanases superfamily/FecR protein